jgi:hypothetical protein
MRHNYATAAEVMAEAWTRLPTAVIEIAWDFSATESPEVISMFARAASSSSDGGDDDDREFKPSPEFS